MKRRRLLCCLLAVVMLSVLTFTVNAAEVPDPEKFGAPIISNLAIIKPDNFGPAGISFTLKHPESITEANTYYQELKSFPVLSITGEISIDGGEWTKLDVINGGWINEGLRVTERVAELKVDSEVKFRTYYDGCPEGYETGWKSEYSNILTLNRKMDISGSDWALPELEKAEELGLIPDGLKGADLTQAIARAEFAAVSVKAYEVMANTTAIPVANNPFTDTGDIEVLKAYNVGITTGVSATEFQPDALLNREQAATMLTRVFKRTTLSGWTITTDGDFALSYEKPALFADDSKISSWAKDSVYFMAANGIINGVGDNKFAPQNTTTEEEATGYANATREQALIIATRMVKNLITAKNYNDAVSPFPGVSGTKDTEEQLNKTLDTARKSAELYGRKLSASGQITAGLKADGTVIIMEAPFFRGISEWTNIVAVSAGGQHTVGLKADGTVVAVGDNSFGRCEVSGWTDIVAISAGYAYTIGLKTDGTVIATGANTDGQCEVSGWTDIVAISAGGQHTVGLKADGTVVAVGDNSFGQCEVSGWTNIVAISAGYTHTVGLKTDGSVVAIGFPGFGECEVSDWTDIVAVSAGSRHTVGLKADGSVVATKHPVKWRFERYQGQCDVSDWTDIVAITAGELHTVGLKADGTIVATGLYSVYGENFSDWNLF